MNHQIPFKIFHVVSLYFGSHFSQTIVDPVSCSEFLPPKLRLFKVIRASDINSSCLDGHFYAVNNYI